MIVPETSSFKIELGYNKEELVLVWLGNVMFIDESSFTVRPAKIERSLCTKEGTVFNPCNLVVTFETGSVSLSVKKGFSILGRTSLVRTDRNLD